jgi:TRAP transporter 4TM/12TM fusion protein
MSEQATTGAPRLSKTGRAIVETGAVLVTLGSVAWAADLYRDVGLVLYTEQFLAAMLAVALPVLFLNVPATKGRTGAVPWYDILAAVAGFAAMAYVAVRYPRLSSELVYQPMDALIVSAVILALIIEGLRRSVGKVLVGVILVFVAYALWGHHIPGKLVGRSVETTTVIINLALDPQALLGTPMIIATTVVIAFLLLGQILFASGGSSFFTGIAMALMGGYRGGGAKIAITASGLFGSISGSAVSNVLSTGVITIPLMRDSGYTPESAGAIEAVASTGGQLMPPLMGASAFVMAEFLEIPYSDVVLAALVPAILYYFALFVVADLEAARTGIAKVDRSVLPAAGKVFRAGWFFPLPFGFLIYALFVLNLRPETAALYSALVLLICAVIFGYEGKRISPSALLGAMRDTGLAAVELILIVAAAGLVIGVLNLSGLSFGLTLALVQLGGGNLFILLALAAMICIVLGMGMPTLGVYVLVAALVAPALVEVGVDIVAAHMFVLYFGMMSMITPPVAIAAFAAASLTRADPMRTGYAAVKFGWLAYVIPFLFVLSPTLILKGAPGEIALAVVTALIGVWLISVAVAGYATRPLNGLMRLAFAASGLAALMPAGAFAGGHWVDLAGVGLGCVLTAREWSASRRPVSVPAD